MNQMRHRTTFVPTAGGAVPHRLRSLAVLLMLQGWTLVARPPAIDSLPFAPRLGGEPASLFQSLSPAQSGIDLVQRFPSNAPFDLLTDQTSGNGVAIGDVDGDDLPDVFLTNYNRGNRLYRNLGDCRFEDITRSAGVGGAGRWCGGATFVDIDGDGDLDLFVCAYGDPNLLYVNQGGGVFSEDAAARGLAYRGASVMMAFADYDLDGDLDGYLVTHRLKSKKRHLLPKSTREAFQLGIIRMDLRRRVIVSPRFRDWFELMDKGNGRLELIIAGQQDLLFRNDGQGRFQVVNQTAGIHGHGIGLAASWWDYNDDGWPDLYVSNDYKGADQLYRNNRDGTFSDVVRDALPHVPWYSMGSDVADVNNDGRFDLLASDMSGTDHYKQKMGMGNMSKNLWFLEQADPPQYMRNAIFLNTGSERLFEAAYLLGLANTDWTWSPKFGDLDNDGWVDLFVSNGMSRDFMNSDLAGRIQGRESLRWRDTPVLRQPNLAFRNRGNLRFEAAGEAWGLNQDTASYGAALADLDRDGDLDLVVANFGEPVGVYRNAGTHGNALMARLIGRGANRWGIGVKVTVETSAGRQVRRLRSCQGFMSANEPLLHFGLGESTMVRAMTVDWPRGDRQVFRDLPANRRYTISEAAVEPLTEPRARPRDSAPRFKPLALQLVPRHRERHFDDFHRQPLLPIRQSRLGPGVAVGDVDADGTEDVYLGGAAGQSGQLWLRGDAPRILINPFEQDAQSEDQGALFFDADGDGDSDLYVVSGGVECAPNSRLLQDRLYLNQGAGRFEKAPSGALPSMRTSGSAVTAADFDRDGDLDLFVGGRSVPGHYPMAADNQLLRNDGGRFTEVSETVAPELRESGIVTSALWSDADGDGWVDLLVAHEWGPIRFFSNQKGRLAERTDSAGLADRTGWWNGIAGGDFDGDGDMDYAVTNLGLNTKYQAQPGAPAMLFYGAVDGTGVPHLIETRLEAGVRYPERGRSCSLAAMPSLRGRFPNFKAFASAPLRQVYSIHRLRAAIRLEADTFESGIWKNNGKAQFEFRPFPRLAQIAPGHGIVASDFDGDGDLDLCIAQNNFSPQPETGRMDGGLSLLLIGDGRGRFMPAWPATSGLSVRGDARALAVVDWDGDAWPDLLMGINDAEIRIFRNQTHDVAAASSLREAGHSERGGRGRR